ncbi:MAG: hypothetical protein AAF664_13490, partial [Planctomycetota bacterium]
LRRVALGNCHRNGGRGDFANQPMRGPRDRAFQGEVDVPVLVFSNCLCQHGRTRNRFLSRSALLLRPDERTRSHVRGALSMSPTLAGW